MGLGNLYAKGKGVQQNLMKAYMWLNVAVASGEVRATSGRDEAAKGFSPEEKTQADAMVRQCQTSKYKQCD